MRLVAADGGVFFESVGFFSGRGAEMCRPRRRTSSSLWETTSGGLISVVITTASCRAGRRISTGSPRRQGMRFTDYYAEASSYGRPCQLHHRRDSASHRGPTDRRSGWCDVGMPDKACTIATGPFKWRAATRPVSSARTTWAT